MSAAAARVRFWAVPVLLMAAHFALRPWLGDPRYAPDLLFVALMLLAMHTRPGVGAVAGFLVGLATDAVAPTAFGAAALAHTLTGWLAGWVRALFVAENIAVSAVFVVAAAWLRDAIQVVASNQRAGGALVHQLLAVSTIQALTTGVAALLALALFRTWLVRRSLA